MAGKNVKIHKCINGRKRREYPISNSECENCRDEIYYVFLSEAL
jgi:hypothetical protein